MNHVENRATYSMVDNEPYLIPWGLLNMIGSTGSYSRPQHHSVAIIHFILIIFGDSVSPDFIRLNLR